LGLGPDVDAFVDALGARRETCSIAIKKEVQSESAIVPPDGAAMLPAARLFFQIFPQNQQLKVDMTLPNI
jgi:hypothetical protein